MVSCPTSRTNSAIRAPAAWPQRGRPEKEDLTPGAWEEARGLIWTHRKRLALGLGLMLISRAAGLVAPFSTKYLMDDVIAQKHWELLPRLALGRRARRHRRRRLLVRELAGARRRRPARHHRNAQGRRGARDAPADPLLRLDQDRRPHLAHHDRRRRHPEPRRHRHRAADRIDRLGRHRARRPDLSQLAADGGDDSHPRRLRRRHGDGVQDDCGRSSASAARSTPR